MTERSALEATTAPVIGPGQTYETVTDKISAIVLTRPSGRRWWIGLAISWLFFHGIKPPAV